MQKALKYFVHTWNSVMFYRYDEWYEIDNSLAGRSIRLLTIERKKALFFGSHRGVEISVVYPTFIAKCCLKGLFFWKFVKEYFAVLVTNQTDYDNLTP